MSEPSPLFGDHARNTELQTLQSGGSRPLSVAVVVASRGRPRELAELLDSLCAQSQTPEQVVFSVTADADLPAGGSRSPIDIVHGPAGSCIQRNRGLDAVRAGIDLIAFFDDDYLPRRDVVERCARLFADHPSVVAANGHLIADGINGPGIPFDEAKMLVEADFEHTASGDGLRPAEALYGCNMVFRACAVGDLRFDERLPLNGWQEDIDFSARVGRRGELVHSRAFAGVHRGVKGARVSGRRFGYSQIANPAYLARKGTMRPAYAMKIASRNVLANVLKSFAPEPWVDRRGRLIGNLLGLAALARGRGDPRTILDL